MAGSKRVFSAAWGMIASLDMCADSWVSWLFEEGEVAAFARKEPSHDGTVESLVARGATHVIADTHFPPFKKALLEKRGIVVHMLPELKSLADMEARLVFFLNAFPKTPQRTKKIEAALAKLQRAPRKAPLYKGVYISYGGLVAGPQTLLSRMLEMLGYQNPFPSFKGWQYHTLETLLSQKPDVIFHEGLSLHPYITQRGIKACALPLSHTLCFLPNTLEALEDDIKRCAHDA